MSLQTGERPRPPSRLTCPSTCRRCPLLYRAAADIRPAAPSPQDPDDLLLANLDRLSSVPSLGLDSTNPGGEVQGLTSLPLRMSALHHALGDAYINWNVSFLASTKILRARLDQTRD